MRQGATAYAVAGGARHDAGRRGARRPANASSRGRGRPTGPRLSSAARWPSCAPCRATSTRRGPMYRQEVVSARRSRGEPRVGVDLASTRPGSRSSPETWRRPRHICAGTTRSWPSSASATSARPSPGCSGACCSCAATRPRPRRSSCWRRRSPSPTTPGARCCGGRPARACWPRTAPERALELARGAVDFAETTADLAAARGRLVRPRRGALVAVGSATTPVTTRSSRQWRSVRAQGRHDLGRPGQASARRAGRAAD